MFKSVTIYWRKIQKIKWETTPSLWRGSIIIFLKAVWFLKARALTEQTYIDEIDVEDEGIAEMTMDENTIADVASGCGYYYHVK